MYNFYGENALYIQSKKHYNTNKLVNELISNTCIDGLQNGVYVEAYCGCGAGGKGRPIMGTFLVVKGKMDGVVRLLEGNTIKN